MEIVPELVRVVALGMGLLQLVKVRMDTLLAPVSLLA